MHYEKGGDARATQSQSFPVLCPYRRLDPIYRGHNRFQLRRSSHLAPTQG